MRIIIFIDCNHIIKRFCCLHYLKITGHIHIGYEIFCRFYHKMNFIWSTVTFNIAETSNIFLLPFLIFWGYTWFQIFQPLFKSFMSSLSFDCHGAAALRMWWRGVVYPTPLVWKPHIHDMHPPQSRHPPTPIAPQHPDTRPYEHRTHDAPNTLTSALACFIALLAR